MVSHGTEVAGSRFSTVVYKSGMATRHEPHPFDVLRVLQGCNLVATLPLTATPWT